MLFFHTFFSFVNRDTRGETDIRSLALFLYTNLIGMQRGAVVQWFERATDNRVVAGSNPTDWGHLESLAISFTPLCQWGKAFRRNTKRLRYTIRFARTEPADCPVHGQIVTCDMSLECPGHVKIGWKGITARSIFEPILPYELCDYPIRAQQTPKTTFTLYGYERETGRV